MDAAEALSHLEASLNKAMKETISMKKWYTNVKGRKSHKVKRKRVKRQAYERYLQTREEQDYLAYVKVHNQVKSSCRKAMRDFEKQVTLEAKKEPQGLLCLF